LPLLFFLPTLLSLLDKTHTGKVKLKFKPTYLREDNCVQNYGNYILQYLASRIATPNIDLGICGIEQKSISLERNLLYGFSVSERLID
jgi:hypothetical protein